MGLTYEYTIVVGAIMILITDSVSVYTISSRAYKFCFHHVNIVSTQYSLLLPLGYYIAAKERQAQPEMQRKVKQETNTTELPPHINF